MPDNIDKLFLTEIVEIYKGLMPLPAQASGSMVGHAQNIEAFNTFKEILDRYDEDYELNSACNVKTLKITFDHPQGTYADLSKLLSSSSERRVIPYNNFYIRDIQQIYFSDESPSGYLKYYVDIIFLYDFLKSKADHINENAIANGLVFLDKKKLVITDEYNSSDLIELKNINDFILKFDDSAINQQEKNHILKKAIVDYFGGVGEVKFSDVIMQFDSLRQFINDELELYMSNFSYEAVKKEVEKDKVDFTVRLNKVFSDIQAQLIGVPVSVILAANGMNLLKEKSANNILILSVDSKNLLIFSGILFYSFMLTILIRNQKNTLEALKDEINNHQDLLKTKHKAIADKFEKSFKQIDKRYNHQKRMLLWIDAAVTVAFGLVFLLFFCYTFSNIYYSLILMLISVFIGLFLFYRQYDLQI